MRKEHQKRIGEKAAHPSSLHDYWTKPSPLTYPVPELSRRTAQAGPTPTLWNQTQTPGMRAVRAAPLDGEQAPPAAGHEPEETATRTLRERLQQHGTRSLSTSDLLALILRTGQGGDSVVAGVSTLLSTYDLRYLVNADFAEVSKEYGLGEAKAAQLFAMLEVARRLTIPAEHERYTIASPNDAARLVRPEMEYLDHEELRVLVLDTKNGVVANLLLYQGTVNSSVLRAAEIFRPAITRKCPGVMVCHNHPSGDPTPSPVIWRKICQV